MVVHLSPGHARGTLVNALLGHCGLPAMSVASGSVRAGGGGLLDAGGDGGDGDGEGAGGLAAPLLGRLLGNSVRLLALTGLGRPSPAGAFAAAWYEKLCMLEGASKVRGRGRACGAGWTRPSVAAGRWQVAGGRWQMVAHLRMP